MKRINKDGKKPTATATTTTVKLLADFDMSEMKNSASSLEYRISGEYRLLYLFMTTMKLNFFLILIILLLSQFILLFSSRMTNNSHCTTVSTTTTATTIPYPSHIVYFGDVRINH